MIIQLIVAVSAKVINDREIGNLLKVIFIPNYNVSVAEVSDFELTLALIRSESMFAY